MVYLNINIDLSAWLLKNNEIQCLIEYDTIFLYLHMKYCYIYTCENVEFIEVDIILWKK